MNTNHLIRRLWLKLIVFFGICSFWLFSGCTRIQFEKADYLLESGAFLEARKIYKQGLTNRLYQFSSHYGMGMTFAAEAMYKTNLGLASPMDWYPAIYHISIASNEQPTFEVRHTLSILHFNLGVSYKQKGRTKEAIDRLTQAVSYDSSLIKGYNLLGALYQEQQNYSTARWYYERVIALDSSYALGHFNLGTIYWINNDYDRAYFHFNQAATLDPSKQVFTNWEQQAKDQLDESDE